jgi:hypothetical protein
MDQSRQRSNATLAAIAVGVVLGIAYTASPLTIWFIPAAAALTWWAGRGASPREQRWIVGLILATIGVRLALLAGLFLFGEPDIPHVPFTVFFGDEQYLIVRTLRQRALWLGSTMNNEAFEGVFELYGRTSYVQFLALVQLLVGPSPYGVRLLSILLFILGGIVLHRIVRRAYGPVAALGSLAFLLFFPSLVLWSSAAMKESLNFLLVVSMIGTTILTARAPWRWRPIAALGVVGSLLWLATLRDGAITIALAGLAAGIALAVVTKSPWRLAFAAVVVALVAGPASRSPRVQAAAMEMVRGAAVKHAGHVYTRGHSYELLDNVFYGHGPRSIQTMTGSDAVRFIERSIASVILFPGPWQVRSRAELAYLPEQMVWYVVVLLAPIGFLAGLRRDRLATCLFGAFAAVALLAVAVNSGNLGTLVRHRALALPYLGVLAVLGAAFLLTHCAGRETRQ